MQNQTWKNAKSKSKTTRWSNRPFLGQDLQTSTGNETPEVVVTQTFVLKRHIDNLLSDGPAHIKRWDRLSMQRAQTTGWASLRSSWTCVLSCETQTGCCPSKCAEHVKTELLYLGRDMKTYLYKYINFFHSNWTPYRKARRAKALRNPVQRKSDMTIRESNAMWDSFQAHLYSRPPRICFCG